MKKVTVNGTVISHERYLYRGYLQIAALDMLNSRNVLRTLLWDPLEPVATRPLALVQDNSLYSYDIDFNKNVTEVFDAQGTIAADYDYSPYGAVTGTRGVAQPVQWSNEMNDGELALVYYNYRYYNPADGRWINRDPIAEESGANLYGFVKNNPVVNIDRLGLIGVGDILDIVDQTGIAQLKNVLIGLGCACMMGACIAMKNKVIMAITKGDGHKAMELDRKKTILCNYAAECARNGLGK